MNTEKTDYMLVIRDLNAGYDRKPVLHRVSLSVKAGEIVALVGPNGAGKSTVLKAVSGLLRTTDGSVEFQGRQLRNCPPSDYVRYGISLVLQGSRVFTELTVMENLEIGGYAMPSRDMRTQIDVLYALFPRLKEMHSRLASTLSTGEKQMLAMARGLMPQPKLLLLDEPSLGLAPRAVHETLQCVKDLNQRLGTAVLLVEQNVREALAIANRVYVLRLGRVALEGTSNELTVDHLRGAFLG